MCVYPVVFVSFACNDVAKAPANLRLKIESKSNVLTTELKNGQN